MQMFANMYKIVANFKMCEFTEKINISNHVLIHLTMRRFGKCVHSFGNERNPTHSWQTVLRGRSLVMVQRIVKNFWRTLLHFAFSLTTSPLPSKLAHNQDHIVQTTESQVGVDDLVGSITGLTRVCRSQSSRYGDAPTRRSQRALHCTTSCCYQTTSPSTSITLESLTTYTLSSSLD